MDTSLFDYSLPPELIAQRPMEQREEARLLVLDRESGAVNDRHVFDLPGLLKTGDLLVFNDSKVFKARLKADPNIEIFLLRPMERGWLALAKPGRKISTGDRVAFDQNHSAIILEKHPDGTVLLDFGLEPEDVFALTDQIGDVPSPPYMEQVTDLATYQTAYARERGSVAAPTAGFHFTPRLFDAFKAKGVERAFVTLHVGLGTFRPIKTETLESHVMHEEWAHVPEETIRAIEKAKARGNRVIAVGTTTVRALESGVRDGFTNLFITPGYSFRVIDGLITNFHLPKSTLLVLVSAFAGREHVLAAYRHAIAQNYRFYSFGDAMFIS